MTEQEYKKQLSKARANYELKQMLVRAQQATADELEQAKKILDDLKNYKIPPVEPTPAPESGLDPGQPAIVQPVMLASEFTQLLEDLTIEMHQANKEMCLLCNELGDYPDEANLMPMIIQIETKFAQRNELGAKIAFLKANGRLPEAEPVLPEEVSSEAAKTAFLANLPADRYEVSKLIANSLSPKVTRARRGLQNAKTDIWRNHYQIQLAKAEQELAAAKSQLSAMA